MSHLAAVRLQKAAQDHPGEAGRSASMRASKLLVSSTLGACAVEIMVAKKRGIEARFFRLQGAYLFYSSKNCENLDLFTADQFRLRKLLGRCDLSDPEIAKHDDRLGIMKL